MKSHRSYSLTLATAPLLILLALTACDTPPATPPPPVSTVEELTPERKETKGLEAASLVGYDGKQVRKNVNRTLNTSDQHNQQLDQALDNPKGQ